MKKSSKERIFLYPKIKCPLCSFYTTKAESLGKHLIDKHTDKVVIGYKKVKKKISGKIEPD